MHGITVRSNFVKKYHMMRIVIGGERCEGKGGVYLVQHLSILSIQINVLLVLVNK